MKKWENPELKNLSVENTRDDNQNTKDLPHIFECTNCGKHVYFPITITFPDTITDACPRCGKSGCGTWRIALCSSEQLRGSY